MRWFTLPQARREALLFSAKAAVSAVVALVGCELVRPQLATWAAISAVIVSQPGFHPSIRASMTRVIANLIGASVGAAIGSLMGRTPAALAIAVLLTGLACNLVDLDDALRPAYAAVVIVLLNNAANTFQGSVARVLSVLFGCFAALSVSYLFDLAASRFRLSIEAVEPLKAIDAEGE